MASISALLGEPRPAPAPPRPRTALERAREEAKRWGVTINACPHCNGEAALKYDPGNEVWGQRWSVACQSCGISTAAAMGSSTWASKKSEDRAAVMSVVKKWNGADG